MISEIQAAFRPVQDRIEANQATDLDQRISAMLEKFNTHRNYAGDERSNGVFMANTHLSPLVSLADLRAALITCPEGGKKLIDYFDLEKHVAKHKNVWERVKETSEAVLQHVTLYDVQRIKSEIRYKHSSLWAAITSRDHFLGRPLKDLKKYQGGEAVLTARFDEMKEIHMCHRGTIGEITMFNYSNIKKMPIKALPLLSKEQIQEISFWKCSREIRDAVFGQLQYRGLDLITRKQLKDYLKMPSEQTFHNMPDEFYKALPFSALSEEQFGNLFNSFYDLKWESVRNHLRLVSVEEIVKGAHLLDAKYFSLLSDEQFCALDFEKLSQEQVKDLTYSHYYKEKSEHKRRIQLIPEKFVNGLVKRCQDFVFYFSKVQYEALDVTLLGEKEVRKLFPGFTVDTLHPDHTYSVEEHGSYGMLHYFRCAGGHTNYTKEKLDKKFEENREACLKMIKNFKPEQLDQMKEHMFPEVKEYIYNGK